jgi:hypothetical protein
LELPSGASEMIVLELFSWRIDTISYRLHVEAFVEGVEEVACCCKASILLGDLSDWPETMEERIAFLEQCAEWSPVDKGGF